MDGECQHCHRSFPQRPHLPNQKFCRRTPCQNVRKNQWRKKKLSLDIDYKDNQRDAQKRWIAKNPDYWRSYRDSHAEYVEINRQKQRERNRQRRPPPMGRDVIAKSDASPCERTKMISGYYKLERVALDSAKRIAKSDASFVKISFISDSYINAPISY